ncbi:transcriptional regulator [Nonomuraea candida]|uniref:transcriptional regulator n=1 Tax=Nonomuraea candida TaxID=359159 RepID=UPI0006938FE1|nr:transcriptional regulator [Nonomuraea candida]
MAEATGDDLLPKPETAGSVAEFVAMLRQLKSLSGLTYKELESRARTDGSSLPRSTLAAALNRNGLPREQLLTAFLRATGCGPGEIAAWVRARKTLGARPAPAAPPVPPGPGPFPGGAALLPAGPGPFPAGPGPFPGGGAPFPGDAGPLPAGPGQFPGRDGRGRRGLLPVKPYALLVGFVLGCVTGYLWRRSAHAGR